jgi:chromosome transmission fidelity protein 18
MKAKEWKVTASGEDALSTAGLTKHRSAATAPDSQLLEFLASRTRRPLKIALPRHYVHRNPVEGETSVPMTLGDGTRIHVRVRKESELATKSSITSQHQQHVNVLGTPIAELMRRVQAIRRKEEHERQQVTSRELREAMNEDDDDSATESVEAKEGQPIDDKLWVDKHAPSSFAHLLSDERTNREVVRALRAWDPYVFQRDPPVRPDTGFRPDANKGGAPNDKEDSVPPPKASKDRRPDEMTRVILLSGPPGVGKTTLAHIIAHHAGYRPLEVNGSDERSASVLTERVVRAMESTTLNVALMQGGGAGSKPKPNCLILDEIDGAESKDAVQSLVDIIRAEIPPKGAKGKKATYLRRPIIFICNNKYAPVLRPLLPFARHFNVFPPSPSRLVARLRSVLTTERMSVFGGSSLLHQLVATSCGDIRSCLYTLQFASSRAREVEKLNRRRGEAGEALRDSSLVDISPFLKSALDGDGMKDQRNDVAGTITSIFRKQKEKKFGDLFGATKDRRSSAVRVLDSVQVRISVAFGSSLFLFSAICLKSTFFSRAELWRQFAALGLLVHERSTCIVHRPYL